MRQRLGLPELSAAPAIYAMANCTGPSSRFTTLVISDAHNTRFEQKSGPSHVLGVHRPDSAWWHDFTANASVAIDSATITFLIDHELHAIAFYPENRFGEWVDEKDTVYYQDKAKMLTFSDIKGGKVKMFYQAESWRPLGFSVENHLQKGAAPIDVLLDNWQKRGGVRVFTEARFLQGEDVYHYQFTEITFGKLPEGAFTKNEPLISP
ncbi:MAG: hypothetical protein Roseis2KO_16010 [Roseivirga sp.]